MAAKDYKIVTGCFDAFLVKDTKKNGVMSNDRRVITESEIIGLFEFWLKKYCVENKTSEVSISDNDGETVFQCTIHGSLLGKVKKEINNNK